MGDEENPSVALRWSGMGSHIANGTIRPRGTGFPVSSASPTDALNRLKEVFPKERHDDLANSLVNFQQRFSRYFPHLKDNPHAAAFELERLLSLVNWTPPVTVRRAKAKSDLEKLKLALRFFSEYQAPYFKHLASIHAPGEGRGGTTALQYQKQILAFLVMCGEMKKEGLAQTVINAFAEDAESGIDLLPETKNVNLGGGARGRRLSNPVVAQHSARSTNAGA